MRPCMHAEIISAPENNITLPLGHGPATFTCEGRGTFLLWKVNGTLVLPENQATFESRGFTFPEPIHHDGNSTKIIRATVSVATPKNNNTEIKCHATGQPGPSASNPINITIAGSYVCKVYKITVLIGLSLVLACCGDRKFKNHCQK